MGLGHIRRGVGLALACAVASLIAWSSAHAQTGGGGNTSGLAGVVIDANGVLRVQTYSDRSSRLNRERMASQRQMQGAEITTPSKLRKVSLTRLEKAVAERMAQGLPPSDDMLHLAGLTRLQYVFLYPDSGDIVIAGPAEGWYSDISGRVVSMESNRPVLSLQDLVTALRVYGPDKRGNAPIIGCSIDPTQEGLQAMQSFLQKMGGRATPAQTQYIVTNLKNSLGPQKVTVLGVPADTHFAQVLVEADYRMKLIGIGLERPNVKIPAYVDKADPSTVGRNALTRWFFMPDYDCVRVSDDDLAMELVGDGVKLVGENEMVTASGGRVQTNTFNRASQAFVTAFTERYPQLAAQSPVYAQLRNLIDMSVAAAFIQKHDYYSQAGWTMATFGDESQFRVETYPAPQTVEAVVASIWRGRQLMTPIGGGVRIEAEMALADEHRLPDEGGKVESTRQSLSLDHLAEGQWWWD